MTEQLSSKGFADYVRDSLRIVHLSKFYIKMAIIIFCVGIVVGLGLAERLEGLLSPLEDIAESLLEENTFGIILGLLKKNFLASLVVILTGIGFGVVPAVSLLLNGMILGVVFMLGLQEGVDIFRIVQAILPHGIFELPAIFIAHGVAMRIGLWSFRHEEGGHGRPRIMEGLQVLFLVVLPLLVMAAVIEGLGIASVR